jgi:hypothetical protein
MKLNNVEKKYYRNKKAHCCERNECDETREKKRGWNGMGWDGLNREYLYKYSE